MTRKFKLIDLPDNFFRTKQFRKVLKDHNISKENERKCKNLIKEFTVIMSNKYKVRYADQIYIAHLIDFWTYCDSNFVDVVMSLTFAFCSYAVEKEKQTGE